MYVSTIAAKKYYSVSSDTLRRWSKAGKINFILTKGKHRRYFVPDSSSDKKTSEICDKYESNQIDQKCSNSKNFIYARVSSNKQKSDLQHQIQFLSNKFPDHTIISDIGSGLLSKFIKILKI
jgi:putative resolvase